MEPKEPPSIRSRIRLLGFAFGGGLLGAITSGLITTFQCTCLYPGMLRFIDADVIGIYALTMFIGAIVGTANGVCKALYGKSLWRMMLGL